MGRPVDKRREGYRLKYGLSNSSGSNRNNLSFGKLDQLDACSDEAARRLLLGKGVREKETMSSLEDHIQTVELYRRGCQPGSCTRAILAMDLYGAVANSDPTSQYVLPEVVRYIVNNMPAESWGSYERVDAWLKTGHAAEEGKK